MEGGKFRRVVLVSLWVVAALVLTGQCRVSAGSFKDCYIKCYVFCIIEPSQTLCSCTTQCFKDCILPPSFTNATTKSLLYDTTKANRQSNAFCKLGCASSLCSNISINKNPSKYIFTVSSTIFYSVLLF